MTSVLGKEERGLLESFDADEWKTVDEIGKWKERIRAAAAATHRKDRRVNIRLSTRDLERLQELALEEGIPYQTLISSVLHKFAQGRLGDVRRGDVEAHGQ